MDRKTMPEYKRQNCSMTLRQALDEFYRRNPAAIRKTGDATRDAFFRSHDTIHVVFGCDTTIHDEVLADFWTIFGSDLGFRKYLSYLGPLQEDLQDILKDIGVAKTIWEFVKALPAVAKVFWRTRKMQGKWSWRDHDVYLHRPLADLRAELNIQVVAA